MSRLLLMLFLAALVGGTGLYYLNQGLQGQDVPWNLKQEVRSPGPVIVTVPQPNQLVTSPLQISGRAKGNWFFEGSLPVRLEDANGKLIVSGIAEAESDWMTKAYVPFSLILKFTKPATATGKLIIEKDNPSGLPENSGSVSIPVRFK